MTCVDGRGQHHGASVVLMGGRGQHHVTCVDGRANIMRPAVWMGWKDRCYICIGGSKDVYFMRGCSGGWAGDGSSCAH